MSNSSDKRTIKVYLKAMIDPVVYEKATLTMYNHAVVVTYPLEPAAETLLIAPEQFAQITYPLDCITKIESLPA